MLALGTPAPSFTLPQPTSAPISLDELTGSRPSSSPSSANHCPYVQHVAAGLATLGGTSPIKGILMVGISNNDVVTYLTGRARSDGRRGPPPGWTFHLTDDPRRRPRLPACTPGTFRLRPAPTVCRGQLDSRPGNGRPVTAADVRAAVDTRRPVNPDQQPSIPGAASS